MKKTRIAYYSIIQILDRDERLNVGVLIFCPNNPHVKIRTRIHQKRISDFFGERISNNIIMSISAIVFRLNHGHFHHRSQLDDWINQRANEVVLTNLRPMKLLKNVDEELNELLDEYIK